MITAQLIAYANNHAQPIGIAVVVRNDRLLCNFDLRQHPHLQLMAKHVMASSHNRQDYLWQAACLELFIADANSSAYTEINIGLDGAWNAYTFDSYRQPSCMPPRHAKLPVDLTTTISEHTLTIAYPLAHSGYGAIANIGVSAIIPNLSQQLDYYALCHQSTADFHLADNWNLPIQWP